MEKLMIALIIVGGACTLGAAVLKIFVDKESARVRDVEAQGRHKEAQALEELRAQEAIRLLAVRLENTDLRQQLAARMPPQPHKELPKSAAIAGLEESIAKALRDVSKETEAEIRRRAEALRARGALRTRAEEFNEHALAKAHDFLETVRTVLDAASRNGLDRVTNLGFPKPIPTPLFSFDNEEIQWVDRPKPEVARVEFQSGVQWKITIKQSGVFFRESAPQPQPLPPVWISVLRESAPSANFDVVLTHDLEHGTSIEFRGFGERLGAAPATGELGKLPAGISSEDFRKELSRVLTSFIVDGLAKR